MNIKMLKPMFNPLLGHLKKLAVQHGIKAMVLTFDEKGELQHDIHNEDVVVMPRSEFEKMVHSLTNKS